MSLIILILLLAACENALGEYIHIRRKLHRSLKEITRPNGDPSCPCLPPNQVQVMNNVFAEFELPTEYGVGCDIHDAGTPPCANVTRCDATAPLSECASNWCELPWCYIDRNNCRLQHQSGSYQKERSYSYATCGYPDLHKYHPGSLKNQTFKISLLNSASGWTGSYSKNRVNLKGPIEDWSGPAVDFIREVARLGEFNLKLVEEFPEEIKNKTTEYFGNPAPTFMCAYMATLGLIDLCVFEYPLVAWLTGITDIIVLNNHDLVLVAKAKQDTTWWQDLIKNIYLVFQPFEPSVWAFTNLCVIPLFGFLMVYHERASNGSVHPVEETVIVRDEINGDGIVTEKRVPIIRDIFKGWYVTMLSAQQGAWGQRVVSTGGKLNLIGIAFFILTINSVYTANLAAVLYRKRSKVAVQSIKDAVRAGHTLCIDRIHIEYVVARYDLRSTSMFALDSDGKPGFRPCINQPTSIGCDGVISRELDFLDPLKAEEKDNVHYCHAAIMIRDEYDRVQALHEHCDKAVVSVVGNILVGMPIFAAKSDAFAALAQSLRVNHFYDKLLFDQQPQSVCPEILISAGGDTSSLDFEQLSGIWVGSGLFVVAGLGYALFESYRRRNSVKLVSKVHKRNQFGEEIHALKRDDSWIHDRYTVDDTGRKIVSDPFDLSKSQTLRFSTVVGVTQMVRKQAAAARTVIRDGLESSRKSVDSEQRKSGASPRRVGDGSSHSTRIGHRHDATCHASSSSDSIDESSSKFNARGSDDEGPSVAKARAIAKLFISTPGSAVPSDSDVNDSSSATLVMDLMDTLLPYNADEAEEWTDEVEISKANKKSKSKSSRFAHLEQDPIDDSHQIPNSKMSSNKSNRIHLADDEYLPPLLGGKKKSKKVNPSTLLDSADNTMKSPVQSDIDQGCQVATMSGTNGPAPTDPTFDVTPTPPTPSKRALTALEAEILRMGMEPS